MHNTNNKHAQSTPETLEKNTGAHNYILLSVEEWRLIKLEIIISKLHNVLAQIWQTSNLVSMYAKFVLLECLNTCSNITLINNTSPIKIYDNKRFCLG